MRLYLSAPCVSRALFAGTLFLVLTVRVTLPVYARNVAEDRILNGLLRHSPSTVTVR